MKRTLINDAKQAVGQAVTLQCWVQVIRHQGKIGFLVLRDISGTIQGVVFTSDPLAQLNEITLESVVEITGEIKEAKQAPDGVEVAISEFKVLSLSHPELAIPVHEKAGATAQEKRLDKRWLDLRKPAQQLIFKVWTTLEEAAREYWTQHGYLQIHSPKLISTASESGAEVFRVDYFEGDAYLAQSPQFYKQMAMASGFERVFEVGPVFRAEPSFTTRHVTEFTGFDGEISFIESHHDVMNEVKHVIVAMLKAVKETYGDDITREFERDLAIPDLKFPELTMAEAKEKLAKAGVTSEHPGDLNPEEERQLSGLIFKETGHEFVFVTDYPITKRPFYHMRYEDCPDITRSFDLLWNGVEIVTGAQREHRPDVLLEQAKAKKMDVGSLAFYFEFFKYGCPPHGGFGMGPARFMMKLLDVENIREVTFLPRTVNRLHP